MPYDIVARRIMRKAAKRKRGSGKSTSYKRSRRSVVGRARPMRALKTNYRSQNVYRFCRETLPITSSFTIIPQGAGPVPAVGYMAFENLQFTQLINPSEFANLFARYKVDKVVTTLIPMFDNIPSAPATANFSYNLELTKVNTKWLSGSYPISVDAEEQLKNLAQLQGKTRSLYASKRPMYLVTTNPGVADNTVVDATGTEIQTRGPMPWLPLSNAGIGVPIKHNSIIFASRIDGGALDDNWKFRVTHKLYFRVSQVG